MPSFKPAQEQRRLEPGADIKPLGTTSQGAFRKTVGGLTDETRDLLEAKRRLDKMGHDGWALDTINAYKRDARKTFNNALALKGKDAEGQTDASWEHFNKWVAEVRANAPDEQYGEYVAKTISGVFNGLQNNLASHELKEKHVAIRTSISENNLQSAADAPNAHPDTIRGVFSAIEQSTSDLGNTLGPAVVKETIETDKGIAAENIIKAAAERDPESTIRMLESNGYVVAKIISEGQQDELLKFARIQDGIRRDKEKRFRQEKQTELDRTGMEMLIGGQLDRLSRWVDKDSDFEQYFDRPDKEFYRRALESTANGAGNKELRNQFKEEIYENPFRYTERDIYDMDKFQPLDGNDRAQLIDILRKQRDKGTWEPAKQLMWKDIQKAIDIQYKGGDFGGVGSEEAIAEKGAQLDSAFDFLNSFPRGDIAKAKPIYDEIMSRTAKEGFIFPTSWPIIGTISDFLNPDDPDYTANRAELEKQGIYTREALRGVEAGKVNRPLREAALRYIVEYTNYDIERMRENGTLEETLQSIMRQIELQQKPSKGRQ